MFDIWSFLLQTLTASGVTALLLVVKWMFQDKLPPKWQFAIWGILGISLLIPAGILGRYVLFNWPLIVELLKSVLSGDYTITRVLFPFPALVSAPQTLWDWVFVVYVLGVAVHLVRYAVSYIRLRMVLRHGCDASGNIADQIHSVSERYALPACRAVAVPGLPSAFVCGVFKPILAVPDTPIDDKVILHELLHLKSRDTAWSIVICILRSIHWCNPLLAYCANQAGNDLEARCDQMVLELLKGEERRDYGRILLSMSNERYANTPGATCVNNGGKNIRQRIESIARFKLYPVGMKLISICAAIILALPVIIGVQASEVQEYDLDMWFSLASARTTPCTTPAGAFDTYAKAVLDQNGVYRVMCAPESMQKELCESILARWEGPNRQFPYWESGLPCWPDTQEGYYIYNLQKVDGGYEGLLVVRLNHPPDGQPGEEGMMYLATQMLRVQEEKGRWITLALEDFQTVEVMEQSLDWGCNELPGFTYIGTACDIQICVKRQTVYTVDNSITSNNGFFQSTTYYDTIPRPNTEFDREYQGQSESFTHLGTEEERSTISHIGISTATVYKGEDRPTLFAPGHGTSTGSSTHGENWYSNSLSPGWDPVQHLGGGGHTGNPDLKHLLTLPAYYAADLYINGELAAQIDLTMEEGGQQ